MMFDWDRHNLKKIKAHGLEPAEVEHALTSSPILVYEQDAEGEARWVYYYGETLKLHSMPGRKEIIWSGGF